MEHQDGVGDRLRGWSTEDLVALLRKHDLDEWQPEVFVIARQLLLERGMDADAALASPRSGDPRPNDPSDLVTIASFSTVEEAQTLRSSLAAAGFQAVLVEDTALAMDGTLARALGRVALAVPRAEAAEARHHVSRLKQGPSRNGPDSAVRRGVVGVVTAAAMFLSLGCVTLLDRRAGSAGTLEFWLAGTLIASSCLGAGLGRRVSGLSCSVLAVAWRAGAAFLLGAALAASIIGPAEGHSIEGHFLAVVFLAQFIATAFGGFIGAGR
jgi:hypothetical protein